MEKEKKIDKNLVGNIPELKPSLAFTDAVMGKLTPQMFLKRYLRINQ